MSRAPKTTDIGHATFHRLSDSEILLFVARTLQPHLDADAPDVFAKLQSLKDVLDQQELILLDWPDSSGKDRICNALAKAKDLVAQISGDFAGAASRDAAVRDAKTA